MTLVAVRAVVDVTRDTLVIRVGLRLSVATGAREHRKIRRISMAGRTHAIGTAVISRKPGMVERGAQPGSRGVAGLTAGGESCRGVAGIRRPLVVLLMTAIAGGRERGVVVVHMAVGARHGSVGASQRKWRVVVIERGTRPRRGVVAGIAGLGKTARYVVRVCRALEIFEVAGDTSGAGEPVISVHVALRALQRAMRPGKSESCGSVVEGCSQPGNGRVTTVASLGER